MPHYRITRREACRPIMGFEGVPGERQAELVGYIQADSKRDALREARERYGSERDVGEFHATEVPDPDADQERWIEGFEEAR